MTKLHGNWKKRGVWWDQSPGRLGRTAQKSTPTWPKGRHGSMREEAVPRGLPLSPFLFLFPKEYILPFLFSSTLSLLAILFLYLSLFVDLYCVAFIERDFHFMLVLSAQFTSNCLLGLRNFPGKFSLLYDKRYNWQTEWYIERERERWVHFVEFIAQYDSVTAPTSTHRLLTKNMFRSLRKICIASWHPIGIVDWLKLEVKMRSKHKQAGSNLWLRQVIFAVIFVDLTPIQSPL